MVAGLQGHCTPAFHTRCTEEPWGGRALWVGGLCPSVSLQQLLGVPVPQTLGGIALCDAQRAGSPNKAAIALQVSINKLAPVCPLSSALPWLGWAILLRLGLASLHHCVAMEITQLLCRALPSR